MKYNLLDHGYLEYIEHWGSDERVIEAARMSTNKGFLGWGPKCVVCHNIKYICCCENGPSVESEPGDEKLLKYLYEHKHSSPFEFGGMIIEIQAPIFVFREWMRHRTASYAELSARYEPLPDFNYVPSIERLMMGSNGKNKQAGTIKDAAILTEKSAANYQEKLKKQYEADEELYQDALKCGIPKELARVHLPVGRYSRMRASANLRNWLGFLTLRMDKAAQWEIRIYAEAVGKLIETYFPKTWELFIKK